MSSELKVDTISEKTSAAGVTIDGVKLKDNAVETNTISEGTSGSGVTIDSVLLKDGIAHSGLVKLASATASSSSELVFDNFVDNSQYLSYKGILRFIRPAVDNQTLTFNFRQGGGSGSNVTGTYVQSAAYAFLDTTNKAVVDNLSFTDYAKIAPGIGDQAIEALSMEFEYYPADGTSGISQLLSRYVLREYTNDTASYYTSNSGFEAVTATTGLRFAMLSGNIASGTIDIFGVKK